MNNKSRIAAVSFVAFSFCAGAAVAGDYSPMSRLQDSAIIVVGGNAMLNPQPLPPKDYVTVGNPEVNPSSKVTLNPQPLPPRFRSQFMLRR